MTKNNHLSANIAFYRNMLGIQQKTLENALGITRPTFVRKREENGFTVKELKLMAQIMHCKVCDLVEGL